VKTTNSLICLWISTRIGNGYLPYSVRNNHNDVIFCCMLNTGTDSLISKAKLVLSSLQLVIVGVMTSSILQWVPLFSWSVQLRYYRFRWYATLENKTPAETFPKFPSVLRAIDRSDRNPPITAISVTVRPSLHHATGRWLVDFDPICR